MRLSPAFIKLKGYLGKDGLFRELPGKRQKKLQLLMFQFLATKFSPSIKYSESEVNDILNNHHSFNDPASLRRFMIGQGLLNRTLDGRSYWKV